MKFRQWIYFVISVLAIWLGFSVLIDNVYILPRPQHVMLIMLDQITSLTLYFSILTTVVRAFASLMISFIAACIFSLLAMKYRLFQLYCDKVLLILRSIPNVTYVILLLFWVSREIMVFIVSFLLLFPVIYQALYEALFDIDKNWKDVMKMYPQTLWITFSKIYLPLIKPAIVSSLISASSLSFKVGVMAEILGQVHSGIGRQMQLARLDVDLASVMAWTIWLLICVFVFDGVIKKIMKLLLN